MMCIFSIYVFVFIVIDICFRLKKLTFLKKSTMAFRIMRLKRQARWNSSPQEIFGVSVEFFKTLALVKVWPIKPCDLEITTNFVKLKTTILAMS